jgi:hypothetical protein
MTTTPEPEPTLKDVVHKLDTLSDKVDTLSGEVDHLSGEIQRSNEKFDTYQKATQWVVQLAFGLIASATIIVIVLNILN